MQRRPISNVWWERGKLLGRGSYGVVSEARPFLDSPLSRHFPSLMAVKSSIYEKSLHVERHILKKFNDHPNIIRYYWYDIDTVKTKQGFNVLIHNIFLEYATGGCLAHEIKKTGGEGMSEKRVREYLKGMLLGLDAVHKVGVVHCDIKPDNILISDGVPKIADFGLALEWAAIDPELRGTSEYMAPETISDGLYTWAADIWSLGCTILKMLNGKKGVWGVPFGKEVMRFIREYDVVPEIPSELSVECRDFLERCLARDYRRRWTAESLLNHPFLTEQQDNIDIKFKKPSYLDVLVKGSK